VDQSSPVFEKVGVFQFSPHRHICAVFEIWLRHFRSDPSQIWQTYRGWQCLKTLKTEFRYRSLISRKWGFSVFRSHRHISAVFELWSTKFCWLVALPDGFPKVSKYVDQSLAVSRKLGFFCFSPHRHISAAFELWSAKFWWPVALPDGFLIMSKYVDQSSSVSRKWGFSVFRPPSP